MFVVVPWGCSPSIGQVSQGRNSPCGGRIVAIAEASPPRRQAAPGPACVKGVAVVGAVEGMHWEEKLSDN